MRLQGDHHLQRVPVPSGEHPLKFFNCLCNATAINCISQFPWRHGASIPKVRLKVLGADFFVAKGRLEHSQNSCQPTEIFAKLFNEHAFRSATQTHSRGSELIVNPHRPPFAAWQATIMDFTASVFDCLAEFFGKRRGSGTWGDCLFPDEHQG